MLWSILQLSIYFLNHLDMTYLEFLSYYYIRCCISDNLKFYNDHIFASLAWNCLFTTMIKKKRFQACCETISSSNVIARARCPNNIDPRKRLIPETHFECAWNASFALLVPSMKIYLLHHRHNIFKKILKEMDQTFVGSEESRQEANVSYLSIFI